MPAMVGPTRACVAAWALVVVVAALMVVRARVRAWASVALLGMVVGARVRAWAVVGPLGVVARA